MSESRFVRVFFVFLIFLGGSVCGNCWGSIARVEPEPPTIRPEVSLREPAPPRACPEVDEPDPPPDPDELLAALLLARYSASEAGLRSHGDLAMIWQCAEAHGENLEARVRWLRRHSRCVISEEPPAEWPARGNCRWARHLRLSGEEPENWPQNAVWARARPRWERLLEVAISLTTGRERRRPCAGEPQTWDGRTWLDERLEDGFEPVECVDPWTGAELRNVAYRFPPWRRTLRRASAGPSSPSPPLGADAEALARL